LFREYHENDFIDIEIKTEDVYNGSNKSFSRVSTVLQFRLKKRTQFNQLLK